jgi:hypothetical protein
VELVFIKGVERDDFLTLQVKSLQSLSCPRHLPWGPSNSVNEVMLQSTGSGLALSIEMQSGDLIEVLCDGVSIKGSQG